MRSRHMNAGRRTDVRCAQSTQVWCRTGTREQETIVPRVELTYSAGALPDDAKGELAKQLAEAMLRWEGAPDTDFFRAISWVHVHELAA